MSFQLYRINLSDRTLCGLNFDHLLLSTFAHCGFDHYASEHFIYALYSRNESRYLDFMQGVHVS